ncbi:ATP-binding cassette domain-containing protein [Georgenia sp. Z1491]|uniref:ATP-binding cassette domain-containing protein n=1 Tax=Georgenia sp. Z1491 TaxID=3416707 RepID=UPI003CF6240B
MRTGIEIASPMGTATRPPGGRALVGSAPPADLIIGHPAVAPQNLEIAETPNGWMMRVVGGAAFVDGRQLTAPIAIGQGVVVHLGHPAQGPALRIRPVGAPTGAAGPGGQGAGPSAASAHSAGPSAASAHSAGPSAASAHSAGPSAASAHSAGPSAASAASAGPVGASSVPTPANPRSTPAPGSPGGAPAGRPPAGPATGAPTSGPSRPAAPAPQNAEPFSGASGPDAPGARRPSTQELHVGAPLAPAPSGSPAGGSPASAGSGRPPGTLTIGRARSADITLDDPLVSGRHVDLVPTQGGFRVIDRGSLNGTFVNGARVTQGMLQMGGILGVGGSFLQLVPGGLVPIDISGGEGSLEAEDLTVRVDASSEEKKRLKDQGAPDPSKKTILDDVTFSLPGRSLLAVIGPSGAGKSTLLRSLVGRPTADEGIVRFSGLDVYEHEATMRNRMGVVPQDDVVHRTLTVRRALDYGAELRFDESVQRRDREQAVDRVMSQLGLTEHSSTRIDRLSGGQRKRVSVALEMLTQPDLLFLDEPTSGLDPSLDAEVMHLLAEIAHGDDSRGVRGRTVVVITHNEVNLAQCDKILILAPGGKTAFYGAPHEVKPYFAKAMRYLGREVKDPDDLTYAQIYAFIKEDPTRSKQMFEGASARPHVRRVNVARPQQLERRSKQSMGKQVSTLARRQVNLMAADGKYLFFLLVLPVLFALLTVAVGGELGLRQPDPGEDITGESMQILTVLMVGLAFAGLAVSVRDLVGERHIYRRESAVGLRPDAYLTAKVVVLGAFAVYQGVVASVVTLMLHDPPTNSALLPAGSAEIVVAAVVLAFTCMVMGLMLSAIASNSEQIMPLLVVAVMLQLVLSGGVIDVAGQPVFEQLAWFMPARWGFSMAMSSVGITDWHPYQDDPLWSQEPGIWFLGLAMLIVWAVVYALIARWRLVKQAD